MNPVVERKQARGGPESRHAGGRRADQDHDLPVLAAQENPHLQLEWESLMNDGIVPALVLGAERRSRGPR